MTFPALVLGMVVAGLIGTAFHLVVGGHVGRLIIYLIFSLVGFWGGHILGMVLGLNFFTVGPLKLGTAIIGCLIFLGFGYWLSLVKPEETKKN